jgi:hypothetical protein
MIQACELRECSGKSFPLSQERSVTYVSEHKSFVQSPPEQVPEIAKTRQASEAVTGTTNELANVKLVSSTTTVPARIGTRFGFRYRVVGSPDGASVKMTVIIHFPGAGLHNPKTGQLISSDVTSWTRNIGAVTYSGYGFDEEWELVPGTWTYEILYEGRKIAEQSFTVVK